MTGRVTTSTGKTFRWALFREGELVPYSNAWKLWVEGSDIYALCSTAGQATKLSFHESGQNHYRPEERERIGLFPPAELPNTEWKICFEWRFILEDHCQPRHNQFIGIKKKKILHCISITAGRMLIVQLLIGPEHYADDTAPPWNARVAWRTRLKNGTVAMLLMSGQDLNEETLRAMEQMEERGMTITLDRVPQGPVEFDVMYLRTFPHINFAIVRQMRHDAIYVHPADQKATNEETLSVPLSGKALRIPLTAPNGHEIAVLDFQEFATDVLLRQGEYQDIDVGLVRLQCDSNSLLPGQSFRMRSLDISHILHLGEISLGKSYSFNTRYDGNDFCVTFKSSSRAIKNDIFESLANSQQILFHVNPTMVKLTVARTGEVASTKLKVRMLWRPSPPVPWRSNIQ